MIFLIIDFNPKVYNDKTNIKDLNYDFKIFSLKKYFSGFKILKLMNLFIEK